MKNIRKFLKKNRKIIVICVMVLAFLIIIASTSYAYFVYNKDIVVADLRTGSINIAFTDDIDDYDLLNAVPMSDENGMISNNYVDFDIIGTIDTEPIYYEVAIIPKTGNTLDTSNIKVYLTDQEDNELKNVLYYTELTTSMKNNTGKVIVKDDFPVTTGVSASVTRHYRLRMWLDEEYLSNTAQTFGFEIKLYAQNENFLMEVGAVNLSYDNSVSGYNCETAQCALEALMEAAD